MMRNFLLAAVAAAAIATPAFAADSGPYVGIEGGVLLPRKQTLQAIVNYTDPAVADYVSTDVGQLRSKAGIDADIIGGYKFGMFRLEGELGYKRASLKPVTYDPAFITALNGGSGRAYTTTTDFGLDRRASVYSAMVNGLLDFGGHGSGFGGYLGGGAGYADVHELGQSEGKFAWQLLAGAYVPVGDNLDLGLKYRYFQTARTNFAQDAAFTAGAATCGAVACSGGTTTFATNDHFASHSLLASLVYNFGGTEAPPPPPAAPIALPTPTPPPAPETQTCPDGSVILATAVCPVPPPPPPPPATKGERGK